MHTCELLAGLSVLFNDDDDDDALGEEQIQTGTCRIFKANVMLHYIKVILSSLKYWTAKQV